MKPELAEKLSTFLSSLSLAERNSLFGEGFPISIFQAELSGLEIIVKYLKEEKLKSFNEIALILNRARSTIYNTYSKSKKHKRLDVSDMGVLIPFDIFKNRKYSVLESTVCYLKDKSGFSNVTISKLLNRSYSTVKTVYNRYKNKNVK